jgi:hypothetical protein
MAGEHLKTLDSALEKAREHRRALAAKLAGDYNRGQTESWRDQFVQTQQAIDALLRAIEDEKALQPNKAASAPLSI